MIARCKHTVNFVTFWTPFPSQTITSIGQKRWMGGNGEDGEKKKKRRKSYVKSDLLLDKRVKSEPSSLGHKIVITSGLK